jgi:hypothetical protein
MCWSRLRWIEEVVGLHHISVVAVCTPFQIPKNINVRKAFDIPSSTSNTVPVLMQASSMFKGCQKPQELRSGTAYAGFSRHLVRDPNFPQSSCMSHVSRMGETRFVHMWFG